MKKQWLKKIGLILLSVFVLSLLVFVMSRLAPGDPLVSYYGERAERMSVEEHEHAMERLGLNEPIPVQYVKWLGNAFQYIIAWRNWFYSDIWTGTFAWNFLCVL